VAAIVLLPVFRYAEAQHRFRTTIEIPDIPGYKTLKCDFHTHTVFSDGNVWPHIRAEEAWREGLDAISITDHLEYQPHKDDLPTRHNRSYEIAKPHGDLLELIVIRGSEVTRDMPPGHLNAIFLTSNESLDTEEWRDALIEADRQGAFIFWNHPGWDGQQPDKVARWYPEHTELVEKGLLHGIEVANEREYYPEAQRWCMEKNLTMLSNSDIHNPINLDYHVHDGDHRPITLVFARERTTESIREALFAGRTAVYTGRLLVGLQKFLEPIFTESVSVKNPEISLAGTRPAYVQIHNSSEITYQLRRRSTLEQIRIPEELELRGGKTALLELRATREDLSGEQQFELPYTVENLKVAPDTGLDIKLRVQVTFTPK